LRKGLTIRVVLFIILSVFIAGLMNLPSVADWLLTAQLSSRFATNDVVVHSSIAVPQFLLNGRVDQLDAVLHQAKVGQLYCRELTVKGRGLTIDRQALLRDQKLRASQADELSVKGIIDGDALARLLREQIDRLDDVQVAISPQEIYITGTAKIMGRRADMEMSGVIVEDGGTLYFRMTRLRVRNARIGTANLSEMFSTIPLASSEQMPLGLRVRDVRQMDGSIMILADKR